MQDVINNLESALADANQLKSGERSEQQRRLAILCTEIEKVIAWVYFMDGESRLAQAKS